MGLIISMAGVEILTLEGIKQRNEKYKILIEEAAVHIEEQLAPNKLYEHFTIELILLDKLCSMGDTYPSITEENEKTNYLEHVLIHMQKNEKLNSIEDKASGKTLYYRTEKEN